MQATLSHKAKILAADLFFDLSGGFLIALGTQMFNAPNRIAPGGVSGLAIIINYLTGLPISLMVLAFNIPLLILGWIFLGKGSTLKTVKSVLIMTAMLQVVQILGWTYQGDTILAALYGGVLGGLGVALVLIRGSTTGGTTIAAQLMQTKMRSMPVGRLMFGLDGVVLLIAAVVYRDIETALFAMVTIFTQARIIDSILYGLDMGKVLLIVTQFHEEVAARIVDEIGRGCTLLEGTGAYTGQERPVMLCAVRKNQVYQVKRTVLGIDPGAFIMAMEANEIIGKGFKDAM